MREDESRERKRSFLVSKVRGEPRFSGCSQSSQFSANFKFLVQIKFWRKTIPASRAYSNFISEPRQFPFMMNSNIILRRFAARSAVRYRSLTSTHTLRSYSTPSEEPDPQLNGYPQLPWQSRQSLPPLGWQDNLMRRNYGDTVGLS